MAGVYVVLYDLLSYLIDFLCSYEWRINLAALLHNFNNIARFPVISNMQYKGQTLFLGGQESDFIP